MFITSILNSLWLEMAAFGDCVMFLLFLHVTLVIRLNTNKSK